MKNIRFILIIGIASFLSLSSIAQADDKEKFVKLGLTADSLMYRSINKGNISEGISFCNEKEAFFLKGESWENYVRAINDKAYLYHALDSLELLKKAVFKNFEIANIYLKSDHAEWLRAKEQINAYYYIIGDYKNALDIINEVIPIKEKLNRNKREISTSYFNLGTAYNHLRDTENALSSFKKSIKVRYPDGKISLFSAEMLNNIARVYISKGELDSALHYLQISEELLDTINIEGRFKKRKIETYVLLVETWLDKKEYKKANNYLSLIKKVPLSDKENVLWYERSAKFYHETGNYKKSKELIKIANELAEDTKVRYSPPRRARRIINYAETLVKNNEADEALLVLQDGLNILAPSFLDNDVNDNPSTEQLLAKPDALKILRIKGQILKNKYGESGNETFLKSSFATYLVACDVIRNVRQGIRSSDSKNDLSKDAVSVYEEAISVAFDMFQKTTDEQYISTAFKLAESNKAQLLLENLNEQEARGFAGIPDSLARKVIDLQLYLATLEDRAIRRGRNGKDDDLIFKTKQDLDLITSMLEKSYPRYYQLKYSNEPIEPSEIQTNLLNEETALLEYFVGLDKIYLFIMTKERLFMEEIQKESEELQSINKLRNILKRRPGNESSEKEYDEFTNLSQAVFNSYVKKALEKIKDSVHTLIIIPDDEINYIPFDILLTKSSDKENSYALNANSYLFEDYTIHYNYSATLLSKVKSKEEATFKANFIGYAPTFSDNDIGDSRSSAYAGLTNLKCSMDEVNSIEAIIGGKNKLGEKATKSDFLESAKNYKIIHLATHAFVDPSDSKQNKIFLQDDFLSDVNLYNLELNTELAVLSACNTGSGELLKGEGVMNLARGFINAGCSSTLMSMWAVDDCTTADLMVLFYKELKTGLKKDDALRQAKINYLKTASKTKMHPYYWAAFVPFGDMKSLDLSTAWYTQPAFTIILGIAILGLVFLYFNKKKSSNK